MMNSLAAILIGVTICLNDPMCFLFGSSGDSRTAGDSATASRALTVEHLLSNNDSTRSAALNELVGSDQKVIDTTLATLLAHKIKKGTGPCNECYAF